MKALFKSIFCITIIIPGVLPVKSQVLVERDVDYRSITRILATDTVNTNTEVGKIFQVESLTPYSYLLNSSATRTSSNKTVYFYLYGSINGVKYYPVDTLTWKQTTADTTVLFTSGSNTVNWRFLKSTIKAGESGSRATIGGQYLKVAR